MVQKSYIIGVAAGLLATGLAHANSTTGFKGCDALLEAGLGDVVAFPNDVAYRGSTSTFYSSENRRLRPSCIVLPRSTDEVSRAVRALSSVTGAGNWDIGVRAGGHSEHDNNAARRGVTIDLTNFNSVELVESSCGNGHWNGSSHLTKSVAQIRPAARWGDVMSYLEKYNLGVTGGRSGHVGVGGLLVSGGASYHLQIWGMSCDNVVNYEVVLADGSVVEANENENADLFRALKGGSNNLGIVTRFDLRTFTEPPNGAFGGMLFAGWDQLDAMNAQFVDYATGLHPRDPDHEFVLYLSDKNTRRRSIMVMAVSTDGNEASPAFKPFNDMSLQMDNRRKQPLSAIAATLYDTGGSHYLSFVLTLQASREIVDYAADIFVSLTEDLANANIPADMSFVLQPLPKYLASSQNILGFDETLKVDSILFEVRGTLDANDAGYEGVTQALMARAVEELRSFSAEHTGHSPYLYMNYANPEQDVIGSYGQENVEFLRRTALKYDPEGFFQTRVPGGFKVSRVV